MKHKLLPLLLAMSLLLGGCGWLNGSFVSVTPHEAPKQVSHSGTITAANYKEFVAALKQLVSTGTEVAAIHVSEYPAKALETGVKRAVFEVKHNDPIGSYAVEEIQYEIGSSSGLPAVSITVAYRHNATELQGIRRALGVTQAQTAAAAALESYQPGIVLLVSQYEDTDFSQFVQDYASAHPETIMEVPQVTQAMYGTGESRVVELIFSYQTSRDALRRMQAQVKPVFESAVLYVSGDGDEYQKFSQLYAFLMERFDYKQETSITPAYSLLRHGIGDSRAFAQVYAAMCRDAGLTCMSVTGTRNGEPWTWNIIRDGEEFYHVDLLRCSVDGKYRERTDEEMEGYVWDYSEYPVCVGAPLSEQTELPQTQPTVSTIEF